MTGFGAVRGPSVAPEGARPKIEVELELPVDITVEDHVETTELGDGLSRCAACGYRWPCPEVRLQPRPLDDAELDVLEALEVGPGFAIERRLPEGADYTPFRGVIVRTFEDVEGHRTHRVLDFRQGRPVFQELHDEDIEPATVGLPNDMVIREAARRLAANIGKRRGMVDSSELELLHDAIDLLRTVLL